MPFGWFQVAYPDAFAGVWSHCPDPVDFRDFQRIDLYAPDANMFRDAKGQRRPLARRAAVASRIINACTGAVDDRRRAPLTHRCS